MSQSRRQCCNSAGPNNSTSEASVSARKSSASACATVEVSSLVGQNNIAPVLHCRAWLSALFPPSWPHLARKQVHPGAGGVQQAPAAPVDAHQLRVLPVPHPASDCQRLRSPNTSNALVSSATCLALHPHKQPATQPPSQLPGHTARGLHRHGNGGGGPHRPATLRAKAKRSAWRERRTRTDVCRAAAGASQAGLGPGPAPGGPGPGGGGGGAAMAESGPGGARARRPWRPPPRPDAPGAPRALLPASPPEKTRELDRYYIPGRRLERTGDYSSAAMLLANASAYVQTDGSSLNFCRNLRSFHRMVCEIGTTLTGLRS